MIEEKLFPLYLAAKNEEFQDHQIKQEKNWHEPHLQQATCHKQQNTTGLAKLELPILQTKMQRTFPVRNRIKSSIDKESTT